MGQCKGILVLPVDWPGDWSSRVASRLVLAPDWGSPWLRAQVPKFSDPRELYDDVFAHARASIDLP